MAEQTGTAAATSTSTDSSAQAGGQQAQQGATSTQSGTQPQAPQTAQTTETPKGAAADKAKAVTQAEIAIKLPDTVKADQKFHDGYLAAAKKHGLSQDQAQGVADFLVDLQGQRSKALEDAMQKQIARDTEALKTDKDFGGTNFEKTEKARDSALSTFFGEETAKLVKDLGLHVNPGFAKGLAKIRALIAEDSVADKGTRPGAGVESRTAQLQKMFPNSPQMFEKR